jgi:hypothetical protein
MSDNNKFLSKFVLLINVLHVFPGEFDHARIYPVVLSWPYNLLPGTGISKTDTRKQKHISAAAYCPPETYIVLLYILLRLPLF